IVSFSAKIRRRLTSLSYSWTTIIKSYSWNGRIHNIYSTSNLHSSVTIGIINIVSYRVGANHSRIYSRSINDDTTRDVSKTCIVGSSPKFVIGTTNFNDLRISTIKFYGWNGRIHNIYSTSHLHSRVTIGIINIVSNGVSTNHSRIHSRS